MVRIVTLEPTMTIDVASIFKAIGPAASIIFAAWIFMGFLQVRYDSAVDRYRELIGRYRDGEDLDDRRDNLRDSILVYKKRCEIMNVASVIGLTSAIILILALIFGELSLVFTSVATLKVISFGMTLVGLSLVILASAIVLYESLIIHRQLETELLDLPDLARGIGKAPGEIADDEPTRAAASKS